MKKETLAGIVLVLAVLFLVPSGVIAAPPLNVGPPPGAVTERFVVVDGSGVELGTFLSYQHMPPSSFAPPIYSELMYMNSNGYTISLLDDSSNTMTLHPINNTWFLTSDCTMVPGTGVLYAAPFRLTGTVWKVLMTDGGYLYVYIPHNANVITINFNSRLLDGVCTQASGTMDVYPVLANDTPTGYAGPDPVFKPIRIERRNR